MVNPVAGDFSLPYFISRWNVFSCTQIKTVQSQWISYALNRHFNVCFHFGKILQHGVSLEVFTQFPSRTQSRNEFPLEWTIALFFFLMTRKKKKKVFLFIQHKYSICSINLNTIKYFSTKNFSRDFDANDLFAAGFLFSLIEGKKINFYKIKRFARRLTINVVQNLF